ncbi:MAG: hypothetical protein JO287_25725 [Pseudonocardiales bacterium]|nr:hypothetical protein [Pseudonocardiales bacterium]
MSGSPLPVGAQPLSVAFARDELLAVANSGDNTMSAFSALEEVTGSPFGSGGPYPSSVAFNPPGDLLAVANSIIGDTVSVFFVRFDGTLSPVPGSPFITGKNPQAVAFSPSGGVATGGLLAVANASDNTVAMFSVGLDGALRPIPGSPFATGTYPVSVAFRPLRRAAGRRQRILQHRVGVLSRGGRHAQPGPRLAVCHRRQAVLGGV